MGGFDKHILVQGKSAIAREIERLTPLVEEGGYIPMPDHRVPPDVPLAHYRFYLEQVRQVWGKGIELRAPAGRASAPSAIAGKSSNSPPRSSRTFPGRPGAI